MRSKPSLVRLSWFASLAAIVLLLVGCTVAQPHTGSQSNGIHIQGDSQTIDWSITQHMCGASLVVDSGILSLGSAHWNTPGSVRPTAVDKNTLLRDGYAIYTPLQFSYMHIHVDHRHQPTSEFDTIGGIAGPDSYSEDDPQVIPGNSYLLVLVPGLDPAAHGAWTEKRLVVAAAFPIDTQGMVVLKPKMIDHDGQVSQQEETAPLSQLSQELTGCQ